jgi:sugar phosphate isomerase/epimerase
MLDKVLREIQVCIPFRRLLNEYLPLFLDKRINPEIGIDGETMDRISERDFQKVASLLHQEGLSVTLHGPFYDLVPGAIDKRMLQATRERLQQALDLVPIFAPLSIVCHTGYDKKRYCDSRDQWLENAVETWSVFLKGLKGTRTILVIENVYEQTPTMLLKLLQALQGNNVGFCFDVGHMNAFSRTTMQDWLDMMGPFLKEVHLHDNDGGWDDHMAIGRGDIDFEYLFAYLRKLSPRPIMTLEAHEEASLWESVEVLSRAASFRPMVEPESAPKA